MNLDDFSSTILYEAPDSIGVIILPMNYAAVIGKILQFFGDALAFKIRGRSANKASVRHDASSIDSVVREFTEPDCEIESLIDQINRSIRNLKLDFDIGIASGESRYQRCNNRATEAERCINSE